MGRIFFSYVRRHAAIIAAVIIAGIVFAMVFSLYELPAEAVIYALVLTAAAFVILGIFRFAAYYSRHKKLLRVKEEITDQLPELPEPADGLEQDYQAILDLLDEQRRELISDNDRAYSEMLDYYTLWAHQIKTPTAAMRLILESGARAGEAKDEELKDQLFRIEQYVEMVLHYLRSESMSCDLDISLCSVDRIVREAVKKYARSFIYKKIRLSIGDIAIRTVTDEKWLAFVIEQILSNSLKYTEKNGLISIYTEENGMLVIEDTGIGIQPEDLPRVFERGFTGFNGREDKKSTGIGLYLCKKIVDRLSHTIEIQSGPEKGTKVKIGLENVPLVTE